MSGCPRNVKIDKLRVLQAEAALLMQSCGSRLQAAHSDATSHARHVVVAWPSALGLASLSSDIHTTAVMAGIQKLLRDETDGVEVLVVPESTPCSSSWSMWHSCFSCKVRQRTPARHSSLSWLAAKILCGTCWNQLAQYRLRTRRLKVWYRRGRTGVSDVSARDSPVEAWPGCLFLCWRWL